MRLFAHSVASGALLVPLMNLGATMEPLTSRSTGLLVSCQDYSVGPVLSAPGSTNIRKEARGVCIGGELNSTIRFRTAGLALSYAIRRPTRRSMLVLGALLRVCTVVLNTCQVFPDCVMPTKSCARDELGSGHPIFFSFRALICAG